MVQNIKNLVKGRGAMAELEIIGTPISNYVRTIRMLCEEKNVPYELNPAWPQTDEVLAIHPAGLVPCMRHGAVKLFESKAIAAYVENNFPGRKFFPEDPLKACEVEQWVSFTNVKVDRWIMREFVVPSLFYDKSTGPDTDRINAAIPEIERHVTILNEAVGQTGYLVGNDVTYADLNLLPMLAALTMFPETKEHLEKQDNLAAYVARLVERPSFKNTAPPAD